MQYSPIFCTKIYKSHCCRNYLIKNINYYKCTTLSKKKKKKKYKNY